MSFESNALRSAAALIKTYGHCTQANARDMRGRVAGARTQMAASFSLYGAVQRALNAGDVELQTGSHRDVYAALTHAAYARMKDMGLDPRLSHPLMALNDVPGFNAHAASEFLEEVAKTLETVQQNLKNGAAT